MSFENWLLLLSAILNSLLGVLILYRGGFRNRQRLALGLISLGVFGWSLTLLMYRIATDLWWVDVWGKSAHLFGAIFAPLFLIFTTIFSHREKRKKEKIAILVSGLFFGLIIYFILFSNTIVGEAYKVSGISNSHLGVGYLFYVAYICLNFSLGFLYLFINFFSNAGISKEQTKYILIGTTISSSGAVIFDLIYPIFYDFSLNWVGPVITLVLVSSIAYAITRYRLMDIRLVLTKSILYFFLTAIVSSFFVFLAYFTTSVFILESKLANFITTMVASLVVVVLIDPLKKLLSRVTDDIFFKGKIEYDQVLEKISRILAEEIDLEPLLAKVRAGIEQEVKIKKVDVWVKINGKFYLFTDKSATEGSFEPDFLAYLQKENNIIVTEELKRQLYDLPEGTLRSAQEKLAAAIDRWHWEMVIPIVNKGEVTAILGLHHKLSGDIYTGEEINFFSIVSGQLAVAIEKSKLYEEVDRFNIELKGKVERATERLRQTNVDLESRNKFLTTTQNISNLISRSLDINNIIQIIADSIASELGYVGGILSFVSPDGKFLYPAAITRSEIAGKALALLPKPANEYKTNLAMKDNYGARCFLSGSAITSPKLSDFISPPVPKEAVDKIQQLLGLQTVVGVPIYAENQIIGVIDYLLAVPEKQISRLDFEMMDNLADQIGIIYRNVKLYQELEGANAELQQANTHLKQLDKAKSEFLSIASHQLRTPISAVKGYLSMLLEGDFGPMQPEQTKIITDVFESSSRLARLINIFLNVSRIESGRFKLTIAPTDMNLIVEGVIKELQQQARIKNLQLIVNLPKKPTMVNVDSDKIREVVLNLIDNAIKYTQKGSITISHELTPTDYHFQTVDTGMGILPEEVGGLFKKFVRGTGVAQVNTQGSGLGLYIAQRVVGEHNGKIWVESPGVGKGSTFQFTIPIASVKSDKIESKDMGTTEANKNNKSA